MIIKDQGNRKNIKKSKNNIIQKIKEMIIRSIDKNNQNKNIIIEIDTKMRTLMRTMVSLKRTKKMEPIGKSKSEKSLEMIKRQICLGKETDNESNKVVLVRY